MDMLRAQTGTTLVYRGVWLTIWWNGSATFNVWRDGEEVDCFTRYDVSSVSAARDEAYDYILSLDELPE